MLMVVVYVGALAGFLTWIRWLWRRAPGWTGVVALVPLALGAWCTVAMAAAFVSAERVPQTLNVREQERQVERCNQHAFRWGMRFWAAGLGTAGWLLFVTWRWDVLDAPPKGAP
jgi:hypothetical protein